jgi:parallel beta-helix repeat protein
MFRHPAFTGTSTKPISFTQIEPETQPSTIITIFGQAAFTHCVFQDAITSSGGMCTIDSTDEVSFVHCHFLNNSAYAGGAVYIGNSDVTFTSSEFINNTASGCAGAIYIGSSGTCNLDDCLISVIHPHPSRRHRC